MAGALTVAVKNTALDAILATVTHLSLHTADPGGTGTSEVTGGSPAYARKAVTWNAAALGVATAATSITFDVPAGTYTWVGLWTASSGGTYKGKIAIGTQVFSAQGTLPLASVAVDLNSTASA